VADGPRKELGLLMMAVKGRDEEAALNEPGESPQDLLSNVPERLGRDPVGASGGTRPTGGPTPGSLSAVRDIKEAALTEPDTENVHERTSHPAVGAMRPGVLSGSVSAVRDITVIREALKETVCGEAECANCDQRPFAALDRLEERLEAMETALEAISVLLPDGQHPGVREFESRITAAQIIARDALGDDDPGNVEMCYAQAAALSASFASLATGGEQ
jgi:hypothetical protein